MRFSTLVILAVPLLVSIYTVNYGLWAWRHELRLGAAGLVVLGVATVAVPALVIWVTS